ncbi:MAG: hypothetical protein OEZ01_15985 [Candidatus Heimdallarchaeota archaeon]|nr:hypothetical protein [Candidatus Heimdallarchaeota archaeon]
MKNNETIEMELSVPMIKMLAHAYYQCKNREADFYSSFMDLHGEALDEQGDMSWYDDEFNEFFSTICDLDAIITKKEISLKRIGK